MLMPKRTKFRKQMKGRNRGKAAGGYTIEFGEYGLKVMENGWIFARQIEAARVALTRFLKRNGKIWIRIFPDKPYTRKPAETRMGKGKGAPEGYLAAVKRGRILFEVSGVSRSEAQEAMRLAAHKLPLPVRFVAQRRSGGGQA